MELEGGSVARSLVQRDLDDRVTIRLAGVSHGTPGVGGYTIEPKRQTIASDLRCLRVAKLELLSEGSLHFRLSDEGADRARVGRRRAGARRSHDREARNNRDPVRSCHCRPPCIK